MDTIYGFHRLLFAAPAGLALVSLSRGHHAIKLLSGVLISRTERRLCLRKSSIPYALAAVVFTSLLCLSPTMGSYNRFWHSIQSTAHDLELRHLSRAWGKDAQYLADNESTLPIDSPLSSLVQESFRPSGYLKNYRQSLSTWIPATTAQRLGWFYADESSPPTGPLHMPAPIMPPSSWLTLSQKHNKKGELPTVWPLSGPGSVWIDLGGSGGPEILEPALASDRGIIIVNPEGKATHAFNDELIRIDHGRSYEARVTIRQQGNPAAVNFLAIAWYDAAGNILYANLELPIGAGKPYGWSNGSYSYFGLVEQPAPTNWTRYTIAFGQGQSASFPQNAIYMRIGALLNHQGHSGARAQLHDVVLRQRPDYDFYMISLSSERCIYSNRSQAGQLSGHWPPASVAVQHASMSELRLAATRKLLGADPSTPKKQ